VQDTATRGFMTEPINLISQVKNASLEIGDHQVIGRVLEQSCGELFFQCSLAPLQIANMMRLCHGVLSVLRATNAIAGKNKRALSRQRSKATFLRVMPHTLPESDRSFCALKKPTFIAQYASATLKPNKAESCGKSLT
jgi:hypothetical protein